MVNPATRGRTSHGEPDYVARAEALATGFAARAAEHDRTGSFPFENFQALFDAGLLSLTVPRERGGLGAGMLETMRVLNHIARGCSSTATSPSA